MAVSSGAGPHSATLIVNGQRFAIMTGSRSWEATKKTSSFSCVLPMSAAGVEATFGPSLGDNEASIAVTTRGQTVTLIKGEIDEVDFDYIQRAVHIAGRDKTAKLHATKSAEKWVNKKPHEIAADIAGRIGLTAEVDQSSLHAGRYVEVDWSKLTDGVSLAHVLHKICELMGAHWYVSKDKLVVKSAAAQGAPYVINYAFQHGSVITDALSLSIRRNVQAGKPIKVDAKSWHARKGQMFAGSYQVGGNGTSTTYSYHLPMHTKDHLDAHAKAKAKDHARHELTVSVEVVGDLSIDGTAPLRLVGTAFAQDFKIDSIEDSFGMSGHTTRITARSAAQGRTGRGASGASEPVGPTGSSQGGGAENAPLLT